MVLLAREYMEKMGIKNRMPNMGSLGIFEEKQKSGTASRPLVFETNASTDSAIRADACW